MHPNDWDLLLRPRVRNRVVSGLDVLTWIVFFIVVTAVLLYAIAGQ